MQRPNQLLSVWPFGLALALAVWIGRVELRADEVQGPLLLVLLGTFSLGLARPRLAWLWGLILGGAIFIAHILAPAFGWPEPFPPEPNVWATLPAIVFGLVGAYAGAVSRWAVSQLHQGNAK